MRNQLVHQGRSIEAGASGDSINWLSLRNTILSRLYHAKLLLDVGMSSEMVARWLATNSMLPWYLQRVGLPVKDFG
jgi:hypothetical protein